MKKVFFSLFNLVFCVLLSAHLSATPLSKEQAKSFEGQESLRAEMSKMILSIADLDIIVNRDKTIDYEIFQEDAKRILDSITKIRKMDTGQVYKPFIDKLEKHASQLLKLSLNKDKAAAKVPQKIFDTCFKCHQEHRGKRG